MEIRYAHNKDLIRIVEIYNQAIESGESTADTEIFSPKDKEKWLHKRIESTYPVYVLLFEGELIGWGSLSPYRCGRKALKKVAEVSYYIDFSFHGKSYGSRLLEHIIDDSKRLGYRHLLAILLSVNKKSIFLLNKFGFAEWGRLPEIADLRNTNCDHLIYGKHLK